MAQVPNADNVAAAQGFANIVPLAPGQVPAVNHGPPPAAQDPPQNVVLAVITFSALA
jgi:hypothetical protein